MQYSRSQAITLVASGLALLVAIVRKSRDDAKQHLNWKNAIKGQGDNRYALQISVLNMEYTDSMFDVAVLIYARLHSSIQKSYHLSVARMIRPGDLLIVEGFSTDNSKLFVNTTLACSSGFRSCYTLGGMTSDFL